MAYTLYMHINKENGCRYIGITKGEVSQRWHRGGGYRQAPRFYGEIQKKTDGTGSIILL